MGTKVSLRRKRISKGRLSLYLDFYPAITNKETGEKTRREFLGMYIFEDKNELKKEIKLKEQKGHETKSLKQVYKTLSPLQAPDKHHNTETLRLAKIIQQKRENYLNKPEIYSAFEKEQLRLKELEEQSFLDYFETLTEKKNGSNYKTWLTVLDYLKKYSGGQLKFKDLSEHRLEDFKSYLLSTNGLKRKDQQLSQNTASSYFNKVKAALKSAYQAGILQTDLNAKIKPLKTVETRREHLSLEELNSLVKTPCNAPLLKRAALFSALTGLRFSDLKKMTWKELEFINGQGYVLNFNQQKTKGVEVLPIPDQAYELTEGLENPRLMPHDELVFKGLRYSAYHNRHLFQWIGAAGITKNISFHNFRHSYAVLQLYNGTDIYTVSKMLGHKSLKTTQVYAKIVDDAKRKAANKIKLDL